MSEVILVVSFIVFKSLSRLCSLRIPNGGLRNRHVYKENNLSVDNAVLQEAHRKQI